MPRDLLGPADVPDASLVEMVGRLLDHDPGSLTLLHSSAEVAAYDLPTITTAGRFWVSGEVAGPDGIEPFRLFVKHVQSWSRSPLFASVPPEIRDFAEAGVPWHTEADVYRSDLGDRLPDGLHLAPAVGVHDLDEKSAAIWLAEVPEHRWPWDAARFERAAHLLGRLAGSARVAPLAGVGGHPWTVHDYLHGRFTHQVRPMLDEHALWRHPLLAAYDADLRHRMRDAADRVPAYVDELAAAPHGAGHGDACPNNLLGAPDPDDFVLIDFGFWMPLPLGFDLGQLLVGEVQLGRCPAATLRGTEAAIVPAYAAGLAAEGVDVDPDDLRRWHALQLLVFTGLSCAPVEHLDAPVSPALLELAAGRAELTRFVLDLVDASRPAH